MDIWGKTIILAIKTAFENLEDSPLQVFPKSVNGSKIGKEGRIRNLSDGGKYNMLRSMMQVFVKNSMEAVALYQKAFDAELLCAYPDGSGGYMHSELNAYGQILAVSEISEDVTIGNTMMFCFHLGEGHENQIQKAYEVLKEGASNDTPVGPCDYSPCQFKLIDKFGVCWCLFV